MKYAIPSAGILMLLFIVSCPAWCAEKPAAQSEFENLAGESSMLNVDDVVDGRPPRIFGSFDPDFANYGQFLKHLLATDATKDELLALLTHSDPKVRTLAIAKLGALHDPSVLPDIAKLLSDNAVTFSEKIVEVWQSGPARIHIRNNVTVGEGAQSVLLPYLSEAGYTGQSYNVPYPLERTRKEFDQYWSERKNRKYCASWFAVRLFLAVSGRTYPLDELEAAEFAEVKRKIREEITAIPQPERTWTCLWLRNEVKNADEQIYSKEEILGLCQDVGAEALMNTLKAHRFPSDDPDIQHSNSTNFNFIAPARFILENAVALLRPGDSATLLTLNSQDNASPWWFIAAARLQSSNAVDILRNACVQFSEGLERATLCNVLWEMAGESQIPFLIDQFYEKHADYYDFIVGIRQNKSRPGAKLIAAILEDKRLDDINLDRIAITEIARAVNQWAGKTIVSDEEIKTVGMGEYAKRSVGDPTPPDTQPLKRELLHRMRDCAAQWSNAAPVTTKNADAAAPKT